MGIAVRAMNPGLLTSESTAVREWVDEISSHTNAEDVVLIDGSTEQRERITRMLVRQGRLITLGGRFKGSFLARSHPDDVARVVKDTHICTTEDTGPLTNWWEANEARHVLWERLGGVMRGRTMYVIPFSMGPLGSPLSRIAVQLTDSPYVVLNMLIMARCGRTVIDELDGGGDFVKAIHSVGVPLAPGQADMPWPYNPGIRGICHFPESGEIISIGSGYGGNALLGKKCLALRIQTALAAAKPSGAMAEHMMIIRIRETSSGRLWHVAAAFPSACGKTNLAMMQPAVEGYEVTTVGDDIAWMEPGDDGRLHACNPESGFFGVAPGTGPGSNPVAVSAVMKGSLFTNVAYDPKTGEPWWPGLSDVPPETLITWKGEVWQRESGDPKATAHANSRFTTPYANCETGDVDLWDDPGGVPIDLILFGGRRPDTVPLVRVARDWTEGVLYGAMISSATTAAAEGPVGTIGHDMFAMAPFFGLRVVDYIGNWLRMPGLMGTGHLPAIAAVNWFQQGDDGHFRWPGFGDNMRVIETIFQYLKGEITLDDTPAGLVPKPDQINQRGLDVSQEDLDHLTTVDRASWLGEVAEFERYVADTFGDDFPRPLVDRLAEMRATLARAG